MLEPDFWFLLSDWRNSSLFPPMQKPYFCNECAAVRGRWRYLTSRSRPAAASPACANKCNSSCFLSWSIGGTISTLISIYAVLPCKLTLRCLGSYFTASDRAWSTWWYYPRGCWSEWRQATRYYPRGWLWCWWTRYYPRGWLWCWSEWRQATQEAWLEWRQATRHYPRGCMMLVAVEVGHVVRHVPYVKCAWPLGLLARLILTTLPECLTTLYHLTLQSAYTQHHRCMHFFGGGGFLSITLQCRNPSQ